jgi:hypothetical protein
MALATDTSIIDNDTTTIDKWQEQFAWNRAPRPRADDKASTFWIIVRGHGVPLACPNCIRGKMRSEA